MPDLISDYIREQKVKTAEEAADDYVLTHGGDNRQLAAVWSRSLTFAGGSGNPTFVEQRFRDSGKIKALLKSLLHIHMIV